MQVLWVHCDKSHNAATVSVLNKHNTGEESEAVPGTVKVSRRNSISEKRKRWLENVKIIVLASPDRPCLKHNSLKMPYCKVCWVGAELICYIHWHILCRDCFGSEILMDVQQSGWDLGHFWAFRSSVPTALSWSCLCMCLVRPTTPQEKRKLGKGAVFWWSQLCALVLRSEKGIHLDFYEDAFDT